MAANGIGGRCHAAGDIYAPNLMSLHDMNVEKKHRRQTEATSVGSQGGVVWRRGGALEARCTTDFEKFPFDIMTCEVQLLGYDTSSAYANLKVAASKEAMYSVFDAAKNTDSEFLVSAITVTKGKMSPPGGMSTQAGHWDVVTVKITLDRAPEWYWYGAMVPSALVTLVSFLIFWGGDTSSASNRRLVFGAGLFMTSIALEWKIDDKIPISSKPIFLVSFLWGNSLFNLFVLVESAIAVQFYAKRDRDFTPKWWQLWYAKQFLAFDINTEVGETTEVGTVQSNRMLDETIDKYRKSDFDARTVKKAQKRRVKTIEENMYSGSNLNFHITARQTPFAAPAKGESVLTPRTMAAKQKKRLRMRGPEPLAGEELEAWMTRMGHGAHVAGMQNCGITTLKQLITAKLQEKELAEEVGMVDLYPRRKLLRQMAEGLTANVTKKEAEKARVKAALDFMQQGLYGKRQTKTRVEGHASMRRVDMSAKKNGLRVLTPAEERAANHEYYSRYGQGMDTVAQLLFPVMFIVVNLSKLEPYKNQIPHMGMIYTAAGGILIFLAVPLTGLLCYHFVANAPLPTYVPPTPPASAEAAAADAMAAMLADGFSAEDARSAAAAAAGGAAVLALLHDAGPNANSEELLSDPANMMAIGKAAAATAAELGASVMAQAYAGAAAITQAGIEHLPALEAGLFRVRTAAACATQIIRESGASETEAHNDAIK